MTKKKVVVVYEIELSQDELITVDKMGFAEQLGYIQSKLDIVEAPDGYRIIEIKTDQHRIILKGLVGVN